MWKVQHWKSRARVPFPSSLSTSYGPGRESTPGTRVESKRSDILIPQQFAGDHQPLDLACPFADGAELHIPIELLDRIIFDKPITPMDLHRLIGHSDGHLACKKLCHGTFARYPAFLIGMVRGAQREQSRRFDLGSHVCQLPLDSLKFGDGLAKLLPLLSVAQAGLKGALRHAHGQCGNGNAALVQYLQAINKSFARFAQAIFFGNPAVLEDDLGSVARAQTHLVFLLAGTKTWGATFNDECRDAVLMGCFICHRHGDADIRVSSV